ncbi:hypothetical protein MPER_02372, partial [Moniliophthora perniciosa FA553]
ARYLKRAGPIACERFFRHCEEYINAVSTEAELRERGEVLDVDAFIDLRRDNSAVRLCFDLFEYALGIELPGDVVEEPTFQQMYWAAADMVCWANDVYSYNMEQAKGIGGNNIVTVLMKNKGMSLQAASDYVGNYCQALVDRYLSAVESLPSYGSADLDEAVARICRGLGVPWMSGNS